MTSLFKEDLPLCHQGKSENQILGFGESLWLRDKLSYPLLTNQSRLKLWQKILEKLWFLVMKGDEIKVFKNPISRKPKGMILNLS